MGKCGLSSSVNVTRTENRSVGGRTATNNTTSESFGKVSLKLIKRYPQERDMCNKSQFDLHTLQCQGITDGVT